MGEVTCMMTYVCHTSTASRYYSYRHLRRGTRRSGGLNNFMCVLEQRLKPGLLKQKNLLIWFRSFFFLLRSLSPNPKLTVLGGWRFWELILPLWLSGGRQHGCPPQPLLCYGAGATTSAGDHWRLILHGTWAAHPVLQVHPLQAYPHHLLPRWGSWRPAPPGRAHNRSRKPSHWGHRA